MTSSTYSVVGAEKTGKLSQAFELVGSGRQGEERMRRVPFWLEVEGGEMEKMRVVQEAPGGVLTSVKDMVSVETDDLALSSVANVESIPLIGFLFGLDLTEQMDPLLSPSRQRPQRPFENHHPSIGVRGNNERSSGDGWKEYRGETCEGRWIGLVSLGSGWARGELKAWPDEGR